MSEEWRSVPNFEAYYQVSSGGQVRSLPRVSTNGRGPRRLKGRVLVPYMGTGYPQIKLSADGKRRGVAVHVLVAEVFIGARPEGAIVRHLNGDRNDNHVENIGYELPDTDLENANEAWRPVPGFEGFYEVSDQGRVRSLARSWSTGFGTRCKPATLLHPHVGANGYKGLSLKVAGGQDTRNVHSLVAEAFIGPRPEDMDVCHENGDKTDNRVENLRYDTRNGNMRDQVRLGEHHGATKTHCTHGHEYTPENTLRNPWDNGRRRCKTCVREQCRRNSAAYRERRAAG